MKKELRTVAACAAAAAMTMASVMTASAEVAAEGGEYKIATEYNSDIYMTFRQGDHSILPTGYGAELKAEFDSNAPAGYEWKYVYVNMREVLQGGNTGCSESYKYYWDYEIESTGNWERPNDDFWLGGETFNLDRTFTTNFNNKVYSDCKVYLSTGDAGGAWAFLVPQGFNQKMNFVVWGNDKNAKITFPVIQGTLETNQNNIGNYTWKQNDKGWWVERPDGSYLVNEWYQSQASGLWYYMGADGYMVTNTITPDGYQVNADGVWVQ